jgi:WD repeat-containing protein 23
MSASQSPDNLAGEDNDPRTIVYDPTDPFWHDTEEDDDDMDYMPAPGESQDEDDDGELYFHGMLLNVFLLLVP